MTRPGEGSLAAAEEHGPKALVGNAVKAEEAGFDFVASSDHFHPWLDSQGHAPFAWSVLGAVAARTSRIGIATGVTCPILRYHSAIVAQAAATVALLSDGRVTLQLGAGERLNEHIVGMGWPAVSTRHAMLREAIEIIPNMAEIVGYGPTSPSSASAPTRTPSCASGPTSSSPGCATCRRQRWQRNHSGVMQ